MTLIENAGEHILLPVWGMPSNRHWLKLNSGAGAWCLQSSHTEAVAEVAIHLEELRNAMPPVASYTKVSSSDSSFLSRSKGDLPSQPPVVPLYCSPEELKKNP